MRVAAIANVLVKAFASIDSALATLAGVALCVAVAGTTVEVLMRGLLGRAFTDMTSIGRVTMLLVGFWGAAYALRHGRHVSISFVLERLPAWLSPRVKALGLLLGLCGVITFTVITLQYTMFSRELGTKMWSEWETPIWIIQMAVPIGLAIFTLQLIVQIVTLLRGKDTVISDEDLEIQSIQEKVRAAERAQADDAVAVAGGRS